MRSHIVKAVPVLEIVVKPTNDLMEGSAEVSVTSGVVGPCGN
jgi:hypothetical protein